MSVYLMIRVLHLLCGATWLGMAVFSAWFLMPAIRDAGPDAVKVMAGLDRRGLTAAIPILAVTSVLSGFWLYWRYTAGFSPEVSRSHSGMAFGLGGVTGIIALVIGAAIINRSLAQAGTASIRAAGLPDGRERQAFMASAGRLQARAHAATHAVAVLLIITTILMSAALYI
jgi:uncharacterized membrane protein